MFPQKKLEVGPHRWALPSSNFKSERKSQIFKKGHLYSLVWFGLVVYTWTLSMYAAARTYQNSRLRVTRCSNSNFKSFVHFFQFARDFTMYSTELQKVPLCGLATAQHFADFCENLEMGTPKQEKSCVFPIFTCFGMFLQPLCDFSGIFCAVSCATFSKVKFCPHKTNTFRRSGLPYIELLRGFFV